MQPQPMPGARVANEEQRRMRIERRREVPDPPQHVVDVRPASGQERPARGSAESAGVVGEHLRRVVLRIDGERHEEDVAPHRIAEELLDGGEAGRLRRARVEALRIHRLEQDDAIAHDVAIERDLVAALRDERTIGEEEACRRIACRTGRWC